MSKKATGVKTAPKKFITEVQTDVMEALLLFRKLDHSGGSLAERNLIDEKLNSVYVKISDAGSELPEDVLQDLHTSVENSAASINQPSFSPSGNDQLATGEVAAEQSLSPLDQAINFVENQKIAHTSSTDKTNIGGGIVPAGNEGDANQVGNDAVAEDTAKDAGKDSGKGKGKK